MNSLKKQIEAVIEEISKRDCSNDRVDNNEFSVTVENAAGFIFIRPENQILRQKASLILTSIGTRHTTLEEIEKFSEAAKRLAEYARIAKEIIF